MTTPTFGLTGVQLRILRILFNADTPIWPLSVWHSTGIPYGTVYHACRVLYDLGWAVGVTEETKTGTGRPARVLYRLTATGRKQAAELLDEHKEENP